MRATGAIRKSFTKYLTNKRNQKLQNTDTFGSAHMLRKVMYSSPVTGLQWPKVFQQVQVSRLHDNSTGWW